MTKDDIVDLLGKPEQENKEYHGYFRSFLYGTVWVVLKNGFVKTLIKAECFDEERHNYDIPYLTYRAHKAILKVNSKTNPLMILQKEG